MKAKRIKQIEWKEIKGDHRYFTHEATIGNKFNFNLSVNVKDGLLNITIVESYRLNIKSLDDAKLKAQQILSEIVEEITEKELENESETDSL